MQKKTQNKSNQSLADSLRVKLPQPQLKKVPCQACNGTGRARLVDIGPNGEYFYRDNCLICHGSGFNR